MKIKKSCLFTILAFIVCMFMFFSQGVHAASATDSVKGTSVPFEDTTYTTSEENKPHDISSKEKANEEISSYKNKSKFGINVDGVDLIKGKAEKFVNIAASLILGFAVIMIAFAGFKIATSEGETGKIRAAKMQIIGAGIGIGLSLFTLVILKVYVEVLSVYNK